MLKALCTAAVLAALLSPPLAVAPAWAQDKSADKQKSEKKDKKKKDKDEDEDENPAREVTYSGIGLSRVSTDFDNIDSAVNLGAVLGLRVPTISWISAEIDFTATIIPGENQGGGGAVVGGNCGGLLQPPCPGNNTASGEDFAMNGIGVSGVLRSPGRFFGTAKYGYRYLQSTLRELDEERSGAAWSVGGGWRWGESLSGVELLYTNYAEGIDFIALALTFGFYTKDE